MFLKEFEGFGLFPRHWCGGTRGACVCTNNACAGTDAACGRTNGSCVRTCEACHRTTRACGVPGEACVRTDDACGATNEWCGRTSAACDRTDEVGEGVWVGCGVMGLVLIVWLTKSNSTLIRPTFKKPILPPSTLLFQKHGLLQHSNIMLDFKQRSLIEIHIFI